MMERQIFQVISALSAGPRTFWEIVKVVDGTIKDLFSVLKTMLDDGTVKFDEGLLSLEDGVDTSMIRTDFSDELVKFRVISKRRPYSVLEFFQEPIKDDDLFKRLKFIYERGDLVGKDIFILGDDDLFSIALALTGLSKRIVVVEIDKRLTSLIKEVSEELSLNIEVFDYNCADPLPESLKDSFDVFICDPVETVKGFSAFMSRGIAALRHPGSVYFGLTEIECPPKSWHMIQGDINKMGLIMTDILRRFSFYSYSSAQDEHEIFDSLPLKRLAPFPLKCPSEDWYYSSFIRLQTVHQPKPLMTGKIEFDDSFYKDEHVMTVQH